MQHGFFPAVHDDGRNAADPEDRDRVLEEELEESLGRGGGGVEGNDLVYFRKGFWGGESGDRTLLYLLWVVGLYVGCGSTVGL